MLKFENTTTKDGGDARTTTCARTCDTCCSAPSAVYCHADMAYLCAACDADIHSANSLSRRHHRVPIQPIPGTLYGPLAAVNRSELIITREGYESGDDEDEDEAASWLLLNPIKNDDDEIGQPLLFGGDVDEYLELDEYNSCQNNQQQHYSSVPHSSYGGDSIVPIQYQKERNIHCFQLGLEAGYSYPASMSQSVSISSMDMGVVPESTLSETSVSHTIRAPKGTIDLFSSPPIQVPTQLSSMDREARVLRYREKKKNRKFDKTIRYASRKAYAETRPRIKGRFAKRRDAQVEVDHMFSAASLMVETAYGVVPTF